MTEPLGELPAHSVPLRVAETLFLAGLGAALFLGWGFASQPPAHERAGSAGAAHLSVEPLAIGFVEWRADAVGPGMAVARAESMLRRITVMLVVLLGAVSGLGQMALAGVAAIARRSELRLRRALGGTRNRLRRVLVAEALRSVAPSIVAGTALGLMVWVTITTPLSYDAAVPRPVSPSGSWILLSGVGLLLWVLFGLLVVQSGESLPGGALFRETRLGEPFRGEVCHPGVPILQVALVTLALISAAFLTHGPGMATESDGPPVGPGGQRMVVRLPSDASAASMASLEARLAELREPAGEGVIGLTSPGFWEGVGHVSYAQTECGECYVGRPPVRAPYRGEPAVIHAINPDTFSLAGIEVLEGRAFSGEDGPDAEIVAVVTRGFADEHFQDGEAIGRRVRIGATRGIWHTVVGVVESLPRNTLVARQQPSEEVLVPVAQVPPLDLELVGAGLDTLAAQGPDLGFTVVEIGAYDDRPRALESWIAWYASLWLWSGVVGWLLAIVGVTLTVGRRVKDEARETALRRAVGATRLRLVGHQLVFGLQVGALGSALGCWLALLVMTIIVPEGLGAFEHFAPSFLTPAVTLTVTAGLVAAASAYLNMRSTSMAQAS